MDDLTIVRELSRDTPPLAPHARNAARARLLEEIEGQRRRAVGPLSRRPAAALAVAAALIGGALVLARESARTPAGPVAPAMQMTSAAVVLHQAARRAAETRVASPPGDRYLYTREVIEETPVDGSAARQTFVDETWRSIDGSRPSRHSERGRSWTIPPSGEGSSDWLSTAWTDRERLPTDPRALLFYARNWPAGGSSDAAMTADDYETAYMLLVFLLRGGAALPADLRAAAFDALAMVPGVEVDDRAFDARGRRGLAIARPGDHMTLNIIIDPRSYDYLGFRDTIVTNEGVEVRQLSSLLERGVTDRIGARPGR